MSETETSCVRPAAEQDVDALVALRAEMFAAMGLADTANWRGPARTWFAERLNDPNYGIFVAEVGGVVVASAMGAIRDAAPSPAAPEGWDVLVSNVCTLPSHRGRGLARQVFDAVMDWARGTGVARAELMATEAGKAMYERSGFALNPEPAMRAALQRS